MLYCGIIIHIDEAIKVCGEKSFFVCKKTLENKFPQAIKRCNGKKGNARAQKR